MTKKEKKRHFSEFKQKEKATNLKQQNILDDEKQDQRERKAT